MKIRLALSIAALVFAMAVVPREVCFAQSVPANDVWTGGTERDVASQNGVMVAAVLPVAIDQPEALEEAAAAGDPKSSESEPAKPEPRQRGYSRIGIGVKVSTLGVGIEAATPLAGKLNVRGGFNMFRYSRPFTDSGIQYDGQLHFQSAEAHLDWFPFGGFHVSPGILFYNGNEVTATASVPGGQTFSVGGTTYESDPAVPVSGTGKLNFVKVSPSIMLGVGNLIPRNGRHFSFLFEAGAAYQGSARVALNLAGNVCNTSGLFCRPISGDPTVQANIQAQQVKIKNDVNPYRFFPVVSMGVGFNF